MRDKPASRIHTGIAIVAALLASWMATSCGGRTSSPPPPALSVTLSPNSLSVLQDGTPATVNVTASGGSSNSTTLSVSAPTGMTTTVQSPGSGTTGTITFSTGGPLVPPWAVPPIAVPTPAGNYNVAVTATNGVSSGSASLTLQVNIVAAVYPVSAAPPGYPLQTLDTFMTTSFQLASWSDQFFIQNPDATTTLNNLLPQHIRMQVLERDIPQKTATTWDFSYLEGVVDPILSVADHSPEFQIARAPDFMYNPSGGLTFADPTYQQFAGFAADLVRYYNQGSFTDAGGISHTHSNAHPITWWGIYNEPNINGLSATQYVNLYNTVVPVMQAADPTLKFAAVELADFGDQPQQYLPTFVSNVTAPVDVLATHFYSTCNQKDSDQTIFESITSFLPHIQYIYSQLQTNPTLANVPVWMTENNINADYDKGGGISNCNGGPFVTDQRGTSAFFAAWRPTLFSKFSQAGVHALYHWAFPADAQYGEVNGANGQTYLSYWVDYWLSRLYASPPGAQMMPLSGGDPTVEILATQYTDGSVLVMMANHAVKNPSDNNGTGATRTVVMDVSALGTFSTASTLTLDATTSTTMGPSPVPVTVAPLIPITLNGYGVTFLSLK